MDIKRVIMIKGAVETLEFFSQRMAERFEKRGIPVWFWDMKNPLKSRKQMERFYRKGTWRAGEAALWTFNFIGLSGEGMFEDEGKTLWQRYGIRCFCMMVDHPLYYYDPLTNGDSDWTLICIDKDHQAFVQNYYSRYGAAHFLPLAGTQLTSLAQADYREIPYEERSIEVLFAGNYVQIPMLERELGKMEPENRAYYYDRIHSLIDHPQRSLDGELIGSLTFEFPEITREELLETLYHMCVVDLYVRSYFRRNIICSLAEAGIRVHVIGRDWDRADCKAPENLVAVGALDSLQCLEYMNRSKISVNVIPWFKKGTHDRIFNGMLQGCTVLTDSSLYLDGLMEEGREYAGFSLEDIGQIPDKVKSLLAAPAEAEAIARRGHRFAGQSHTWADRVDQVIDNIMSCV